MPDSTADRQEGNGVKSMQILKFANLSNILHEKVDNSY